MERIEYVTKMEDYAEGITRSLLHIRRDQKPEVGKLILGFLFFDVIILGILYILKSGWLSVSVWAIILLIIELIMILRRDDHIRESAKLNAKRVYEDASSEGGPRTIWFDREKIRDESTNHILEIRWNGIRDIALKSDCLIFNAGREFLFVLRNSVVAGDFERFASEAMKIFQEVKQQQSPEAAASQLDQSMEGNQEGKRRWTGFFFEVLWCVIFYIVGRQVLQVMGIGAIFFIGIFGLSESDSQARLPELFDWISRIGANVCLLVGLVLGAMGKLPGTRKKDQKAKIKE